MEAMHTTDTVFKPSSSSACNRRPWACHQLNAMSARTRKRLQRRTKQARKQTSAEQALDTDTATQMRRANENVQEAFASGNPETLRENGDDMLEAYLKQMEAVRKKVLEQPGTLPQLVLQLHQGDTDAQTKAAEMLFCVVGQGPGRDREATKQALDNKLLEALLAVIKDAASQPASRVQKDQEVQQLLALMVAMLAQITTDEEDTAVIEAAVAQGAIKTLHSAFDMLSAESGSQQNLVSLLWHWSVQGGSIRKQIMDCGMAELQVSLLGLQYSPVQRQTAADQLSAYVAYPNMTKDENQPRDVRLAEDLISVGAPMALIEMLSSSYHELVRCSAGQAIATLATVSPGDKLKIVAAGACRAVVGMMQPTEPAAVRESGAVLMITLAAGNPEGPVFVQNEAAVQFAAMGAIPALADMLSPVYEPNTRVMALQAVSVLASALEERVQKALVSADILSITLDLLRVLAGRLEWDSSFDELKEPTLIGMRVKCAEILACLGVRNKDNIRLLVDTGAIPEMTVVASDTDIREDEREPIMRMLQHMCQSDGDVLAILSAMMAD